MNRFRFIGHLLQDYKIGAVTPTSSRGVKKMCAPIDFSKKNVIVEYGSGTGVFSDHILKRMTPDSTLILVELNPKMAAHLRERFTDERVRIFEDNAVNVKHILAACGEERADYVVSCIPYSLLPNEETEKIVHNTREILRTDGRFLVFAYFIWKRMTPLHGLLKQDFRTVKTTMEFVNVPPMFIIESSN
jgi:phosphatidylethanolamine/phosphatidyl-N-methylethanolamine N-methyltransferase